MSVTVLIVEGDLDTQILTAICAGSPVVERGGSKNSLGPQVIQRRIKASASCAQYLRDRDFDHLPVEPAERTKPTVDREEGSDPLGWRLCRHEMENYLIDPFIVRHVHGVDESTYAEALQLAAHSIRDYQTARWVIGQCRAQLEPPYRLETRRTNVRDYALPATLEDVGVQQWLRDSTRHFLDRVTEVLEMTKVDADYRSFQEVFNEEFVSNTEEVLTWFSGKDLIAALRPWCTRNSIPEGTDFVNSLRDWVLENVDAFVAAFAEWKWLRAYLRESQ